VNGHDLGVICDGGTPGPDAFGEHGCAEGVVTQRVSLEVFLDSDSASNENPDLGPARLLLDGDLWQADSQDCDEAGVLGVDADGAAHVIELELTEEAREPQDRFLDGVSVETLQISHFATAGLLERRFSSVSPDSDDFVQHLSWSAPSDEDGPDRVGFYFVVRDQRGGASWLTRTVCIER
jgi:hypothetical protein